MTAGRTAGLSRLPYATMLAWRSAPPNPAPEIIRRYKHLHVAMAWVWAMTNEWSRLMGGDAPIWYWYVRDVRDGTEHHLSDYPGGVRRHATEIRQGGTLI